MGKQELVDHMDTVVFDSEGSHHLGRDGRRVGVCGLDGCHGSCVGGEVVDDTEEMVSWL